MTDLDHNERERLFALANDYVDGELSAEEASAFEAELSRSEAARDLVADLRALAVEVDRLPRAVEPGHDLWPSIEDRLSTPSRPAAHPASASDGARQTAGPLARIRSLLRFAWRPAPALALAGTAAAVIVVLRLGSSEPDPTSSFPLVSHKVVRQDDQGERMAPADEPNVLDSVLPHEGEYVAALAVLDSAYESRRDELGATTLETFDDNIRVVDAAIASTRAASLADPSSEDLKAMLDHAYRRKIELLRTATYVEELSI